MVGIIESRVERSTLSYDLTIALPTANGSSCSSKSRSKIIPLIIPIALLDYQLREVCLNTCHGANIANPWPPSPFSCRSSRRPSF